MWPESVDLDINRPCQTLVASGYLKVLNVHVELIDAHSQMHMLRNLLNSIHLWVTCTKSLK